VISVAVESPAARAGLQVGDELLAVDGEVPRDVIAYRLLVDEARPVLTVRRGGRRIELEVPKEVGEACGAEVSSPVFDRVKTCDNHCAFCFIYQLPKGLRRSLYVKDDDYRLSFLYGNFTTLTRFTELDVERVVRDGLSPLYVSIHTTDPDRRARMLRNRRGATSLRWLRALLDAGVEVHGQLVICPGLNDGDALEATLADIADLYPELASAACVPVGISRYSTEPELRPHGPAEAAAVLETVDRWQGLFRRTVGRALVHAADEYYLLAGEPFPPAAAYEGFPQLENGVGMAARFAAELLGHTLAPTDGGHGGFFAAVDGAPAAGYRAPRSGPDRRQPPGGPSGPGAPASSVAIVTGGYGGQVLRPLLERAGWLAPHGPAELLVVPNDFFGGTIAVTGLLAGADVARAVGQVPTDQPVLLPDVCLSQGRFVDGWQLADLPRPVEVLPSTGVALCQALHRLTGRTIGAPAVPAVGSA
jgi:putative radical SAM enzyme (TIGR03279 family)